jgi:hypothetical protein
LYWPPAFFAVATAMSVSPPPGANPESFVAEVWFGMDSSW